MCRCESFNPGMTVWPRKSIASVSGFLRRRTSEFRPTEAIFPSSTAMASAKYGFELVASFLYETFLGFPFMAPAARQFPGAWPGFPQANGGVLLQSRKPAVNQQKSAGNISRLGTGQVCRHSGNLIRVAIALYSHKP